jgi:hypothetical protein
VYFRVCAPIVVLILTATFEVCSFHDNDFENYCFWDTMPFLADASDAAILNFVTVTVSYATIFKDVLIDSSPLLTLSKTIEQKYFHYVCC